MRKLPISDSDFANVRREQNYYVDKSLLIRDLIDAGQVCLITRPRRFGKTLNLSMLKYFYTKAADYRDCFEGLNIMQCGESHLKKMGQHPVIHLSMKEVRQTSWEESLASVKEILVKTLREHNDILSWEGLHPEEKNRFNRILTGAGSQKDLTSFLASLSEALYRFHGKKAVILIDEYDAPSLAAYLHGYYEEMIEFLRDFLSSGFKDNVNLEKGVLTGIMRIAKESIFSGLNNPDVYTLLTHKLAAHFGFTLSEVKQMLADFGMNGKEMADIHEWYNGYSIGSELIFNPWAILNYVDKPEDGLKPYWVETSTNDLLKRLFFGKGANIEAELESLIRGKKLRKVIHDSLIYAELEQKKDAVWALLLSAGYLKAENPRRDGDPSDPFSYELSIPNLEVNSVYRNKIRDWLVEKAGQNDLDHMLESIRQGNVREFYRYLRKFALGIFSYYDVQNPEPERFYHAFLLGLLVNLTGEYNIRSNRESGYGRYDLMLLPKDKTKPGIVMELKSPDDLDDESLEQALEAAISQLQTKQYETELHEQGYPRVLRWAVAVQGKAVLVQEV